MYPKPENILPYHGEALYYRDFFSGQESDTYFQHLIKHIAWKQEPIKLFGKTIMQPRLTALYGDAGKGYSYSGITMQANSWSHELQKIKGQVENISGATFNVALLNLYRDGNDSMGWHRDNEKELGKTPIIASLSFGAVRKFQLRDYATKKEMHSVDLKPGSLLLMGGESQQFWEHRLPKSTKNTGIRINITFRVIK